MRPMLLAALVITIQIPASLGAARSEPLSWGKPGVPIDQYRSDAVACGRSGYYLDVSNTEAAGVFKGASRQLEANETNLQTAASMIATEPNPDLRPARIDAVNAIVGRSARIVEAARPQERIRQIGQLMQGKVDACLRERGYVRFRLTPAQRKRLQHLHLGSPERHDYLYRLSSDPAVLNAQAAPA
jgi:hypothetical protein